MLTALKLKEAYRFHPGVAHNLPRVVPKGGMTIAGNYFPEGVSNPHYFILLVVIRISRLF